MSSTTPPASGEGGALASPLEETARWEGWLFAALLLVELIPVWAVRYFPTQDGPAHVENAAVLRSWFCGGGGMIREFYQLRAVALPNLLGHVFLAGLTGLFSPRVAEKILVSGYVILLPLAGRYAARAIRRGGGWVAFLVFPLVYNRPFERGFYNFSLGLALMLLLIGYWARHRERMNLRRGFVLMVIALLLYFAHLSTAIAGLGVVGLLSVVLIPRQEATARRLAGYNFWAVLLPWASLLPAGLLCAWYVLAHPLGTPLGWPAVGRLAALHDLAVLDVLVTHQLGEVFLAVGFSLLLVVTTIVAAVGRVRGRRICRWDALLALAVVFFIAYMRARDRLAIGLYVPERLALVLVLVMILWISAQALPKLMRQVAVVAAALLAVGWAGLNLKAYSRLSRCYEEYVAVVGTIVPGKTLLSLSYSTQGFDGDGRALSLNTAPLLHVAGYVAAGRGVIDLGNYEAASSHFPLHFREGVGPDGFGGIEPIAGRPPCADIAGWEKRSGKRVDCVVLWWAREGDEAHPCTLSLRAQLAREFERVDGRGRVELYRRR